VRLAAVLVLARRPAASHNVADFKLIADLVQVQTP
jgi:hypothetical protein